MVDKTDLAAEFVDARPHQAARILETQPSTEVSAFVDRIPDPLSSKALASMQPYHAAQCLAGLTDANAARYLQVLPAPGVAAILLQLPAEDRRRMTEALPRGLALRVGLLLRFSADTVGHWMDPGAPTMPRACDVAEAMRRLQEDAHKDQHVIYLVDDNNRLVASTGLGTLVWSQPQMAVSKLATPVDYRLAAASTLEAALANVGWTISDQLPVVDREDKLVGVMRFVRLRAALSRQRNPARPTGETSIGDGRELETIWYRGLAAVMNAALARSTAPSDPGRAR